MEVRARGETCGDRDPDATRTRAAGRWVAPLAGIATLIAVIVIVTRTSEPRDFLRLVQGARPWWIVVALGLQATTYVAVASVWRAVASFGGQALPLRATLRIALAKLFVDQTLPSVGISGGVLLASALGLRGVPHPVVAATIVVDIASYYFAYALGLGSAVAIAAAGGHLATIVIVLALVFVAVAIGIGTAAIALSRANHLPEIRGLRRAERWLTAADPRLTANLRLLARATGYQLAIVVLDGMTMWALLRAIGVHAPIAGVFASFMVASLARTLSITPAGLGVFEAVGVLALHQLGVSNAAALSATVLFRGLSYWLPMIPGFVASRGLR